MPARATWRGRLAARLAWGLVRVLDASLRHEMAESAGLARVLEGPVIFAIWHNRLALSLMLYRRYVTRVRPGRRMAAMVSASRDGGLLARVLELFGVQPVRGSSSRRGAQALLEMASWASRGYDLAITPDGPRGPRYVVQDGVVAVAQVTGLPLVPIGVQLPWRWEAGSWDRFQVPIPFGRCRLYLGEPIVVPRGATDLDRERARAAVETWMREVSADA